MSPSASSRPPPRFSPLGGEVEDGLGRAYGVGAAGFLVFRYGVQSATNAVGALTPSPAARVLERVGGEWLSKLALVVGVEPALVVVVVIVRGVVHRVRRRPLDAKDLLDLPRPRSSAWRCGSVVVPLAAATAPAPAASAVAVMLAASSDPGRTHRVLVPSSPGPAAATSAASPLASSERRHRRRAACRRGEGPRQRRSSLFASRQLNVLPPPRRPTVSPAATAVVVEVGGRVAAAAGHAGGGNLHAGGRALRPAGAAFPWPGWGPADPSAAARGVSGGRHRIPRRARGGASRVRRPRWLCA